jgi:hypothetical protein
VNPGRRSCSRLRTLRRGEHFALGYFLSALQAFNLCEFVKFASKLLRSLRSFAASVFAALRRDEERFRVVRVFCGCSIQPLPNFPICIQRHALTPIHPAHVADAHEIGRGQAVRRANLHAQQRRLAAETHRADAEFICCLQNVLLQPVEFGIRIAVVEFAEELRLAQLVAGCTVAADAHTEDARSAALALRLQHGVENRPAAAVEVAVRVEFFVRQ